MNADTLQAISGLMSVVIALVALITAVRSESRANKQFEENIRLQQEADERAQTQFEENIRLQHEVVEISHKPVLTIGYNHSWDTRSVNLSNVGNGTAVITQISFTRADRQSAILVNVLTFPNQRAEIYQSTSFADKSGAYLKASETISLFCVSRDLYQMAREKAQELDPEALKAITGDDTVDPNLLNDSLIQETLQQIGQQLKELHIRIDYQDIIGNTQEPLIVQPTQEIE